jgi:hypothetical protein
MAVQMPKAVRVGAHTYTILRKSAAIMGEDLGHCDSAALQIWVRERLRKSKAQEILLHEIIHAIVLQALGCERPYTDEEYTVVVAPLLLQVLQENVELVEYITELTRGL